MRVGEHIDRNKPYSRVGKLLSAPARLRGAGSCDITRHLKSVIGQEVSGQVVSWEKTEHGLDDHDAVQPNLPPSETQRAKNS